MGRTVPTGGGPNGPGKWGGPNGPDGLETPEEPTRWRAAGARDLHPGEFPRNAVPWPRPSDAPPRQGCRDLATPWSRLRSTRPRMVRDRVGSLGSVPARTRLRAPDPAATADPPEIGSPVEPNPPPRTRAADRAGAGARRAPAHPARCRRRPRNGCRDPHGPWARPLTGALALWWARWLRDSRWPTAPASRNGSRRKSAQGANAANRRSAAPPSTAANPHPSPPDRDRGACRMPSRSPGQGAGGQAQDRDDDELPQHERDQGVDKAAAPVGDGRPRQAGQGQRQKEDGHVHGSGPDQEFDPHHQCAERHGEPAQEHHECGCRRLAGDRVADSPVATEVRKWPLSRPAPWATAALMASVTASPS